MSAGDDAPGVPAVVAAPFWGTDMIVDRLNVLTLRKDGHWYVWIYRENHKQLVIQSIGKCASNHDLNLTWGDAANLCSRLRGNSKERNS